jgi:hypothetical protein
MHPAYSYIYMYIHNLITSRNLTLPNTNLGSYLRTFPPGYSLANENAFMNADSTIIRWTTLARWFNHTYNSGRRNDDA